MNLCDFSEYTYFVWSITSQLSSITRMPEEFLCGELLVSLFLISV